MPLIVYFEDDIIYTKNLGKYTNYLKITYLVKLTKYNQHLQNK